MSNIKPKQPRFKGISQVVFQKGDILRGKTSEYIVTDCDDVTVYAIGNASNSYSRPLRGPEDWSTKFDIKQLKSYLYYRDYKYMSVKDQVDYNLQVGNLLHCKTNNQMYLITDKSEQWVTLTTYDSELTFSHKIAILNSQIKDGDFTLHQ